MANLCKTISASEVKDFISSRSSLSSPGPDGISYEFYKLIIRGPILKGVLDILNHCLKFKTWPEIGNESQIILLLKTASFNGNPSDLRPITLLNTFRKIFTGVLTIRLTWVLDKHHILKGNQFGFLPNKSTSDYLTTFRHVIDHSRLKNQNLFVALLDISKAFDTVPLIAQKLSMQRIGLPDHLIEIFLMLQKDRSCSIFTAYGQTESFSPNRGFGQGDINSPIGWNIFYDPLLCRLQRTIGYALENININHISFADDLKTLAQTAHNLQKQLDIITSYLTLFEMKINHFKTLIISNLHISNEDLRFFIGDEQIPLNNHKGRSEIFRTLGCFWTLDGYHAKTLDHAYKEILSLTKSLKIKHVPSYLSTYIVNMALIPLLQYRLQNTPIPDYFALKVDRLFREIVRSKFRFSEASNLVIHAKDLGIGLDSFLSISDQRKISNSLLHIRSKDIPGLIHKSMAAVVTKKLKLPRNILSHPVKFELRPKPFILDISNIQFYHDLQVRTVKENLSDAILDRLAPDQYQSDVRILQYLSIEEMYQVVYHPRTVDLVNL
jgi:hypothetical protein